MGLLDVLGSVVGAAAQGQPGGGLGAVLGSVLNSGASTGGLGDVLGGLLGNDGAHGGLDALADKFRQSGLGAQVDSWIGAGHNLPVSADQITQVLGSDAVAAAAGKLGIDPQQASSVLAQVLPGVIDHLTPGGQSPAGGLGNMGDLAGVLGSLLGQR